MKGSGKVWFLGVATLLAAVFGGMVASAAPDDFEDVSIRKRLEPRYPAWAYKEGISEGFARIAFYVDEQGQASEFLVLEHSYDAFAEELLKVARSWDFEPARYRGNPVRRVCHAYWNFLPDQAIETNALFDVGKRFDQKKAEPYRSLKYRNDTELDTRIGMLRFAGLVLEEGSVAMDERPDSVTARLSFYVDQNGSVALPQVLESEIPKLSRVVEDAFKQSVFEIPLFDQEPTIALLERTYQIPIVWVEEAPVRLN